MLQQLVPRIILLSLLFVTSVEAQLPQVVAFLGQKRVGKDTAAEYLIEHHGYKRLPLAEPVKRAVQDLFQFSDGQLWGDDKDRVDPFWGATPREVLQFVGIDTLYGTIGERFPQIGKQFHTMRLKRWMAANQGQKIVITDLRMQEDARILKEMGALIIRIERPGVQGTDSHISEQGVALIQEASVTVINDGSIPQLHKKIALSMEQTHGNS